MSSLLTPALKAHNLSLTTPRRQVYDQLTGHEPLTMAELVSACLPYMDRASVYRTIDLFERLGIVQRLHIGWKYKLELSNSFQEHHHHLTCISCGLVIPLAEDTALENRLVHAARQYQFKPQDHQLEIRGVCHACQVKGT